MEEEKEADERGEDGQKSQPKRQLTKRVRKLYNNSSDSSGEEISVPFPFQDPSQRSQDTERERSSPHARQPATKKRRKWVDSDSDLESTGCSSNTAGHERGEREADSGHSSSVGGGEASEGVEVGGGREVESDSEGEGALQIDLEHQSLSSAGEEEGEGQETSIQSPVCDTVELLHTDGDEVGEREDSETVEHGSLATLAMHY